MPLANTEGELSIRPFYPQMTQIGVDLLVLVEDWIVKFEGVQKTVLANNYSATVEGNPVFFAQDDYFALVAGFEYPLVGVFDSVFDVNVLLEYQFDDRDELATTTAQNDLMAGTRIVFNDMDGTEILVGVVQDLDHSNVRSGFIEASSRLSDHWKWYIDAWYFSSDEPLEPSYLVRRDDYIQFSLEYYF
ncbi:hypothetical protein RS130_11870 [Paraglaciecola aquimarina]|uniref:Uncharacterized protein n=1 Tax=Paraglaciecola aquimarina TaxID=1235557 RepID=A0ABU3SWZ4_9ALTE|nr:hypothetical protein [Paraglaciecola aquimarina]MDU0354539.1 hypothetical protein [Paraglaciecola aquimarina]